MDVDLDQLSISDLVHENTWDETRFNAIFGPNTNMQDLLLSTIDNSSCNHWSWNPTIKHLIISTSVYKHLNLSNSNSDSWNGWAILWKLHTAPRVKHFLWTLFHGRLSIYNYLYHLRLGPNTHCILCGLAPETTDHHFCYYSKIQSIWSQFSLQVNTHIQFPNGFASGN